MALAAASLLAADLKCGTCHVQQTKEQMHSPMAHALAIPENNPLFAKHPALRVQKDNFTYSLETKGSVTTYSVNDGKSSISVPVHWSFGVENQTYVFEYEGRWYESLVSYYKAIDGLDTTIGDSALHPATLIEALGRPIGEKERGNCFGCHSSGSETNGGVDLSALTPGVTCDHCHTGALQHQNAALKGSPQFMPQDLKSSNAEQMSSFCGQCHRTWETVMRMPIEGTVSVRFQPYRLAISKCYIAADRRISCIECHNPHEASLPVAETVTAKCLVCHSSSASLKTVANVTSAGGHAKPCPVSKTDCASCHMPKVDLPGGHRAFTDHYIRVVHPGDPYPY